RERRSGAKPIFQYRLPDLARRSEIRHRLAGRLRMVAGAVARAPARRPLSRGSLVTDFWSDRSTRDRGMDPSRQTPGSFPAPDAQVHLDAHAARSLRASVSTGWDKFSLPISRALPLTPPLLCGRDGRCYPYTERWPPRTFGKNAVSKPISGRKEQSRKTYS